MKWYQLFHMTVIFIINSLLFHISGLKNLTKLKPNTLIDILIEL